MMNWKVFEGSGLVLRYYRGLCLEGLKKSTKTVSKDSRSPGPVLNPEPPEYEAGVLKTGKLNY
jgi:hypothetical protein